MVSTDAGVVFFYDAETDELVEVAHDVEDMFAKVMQHATE